MGKDPIKKIQNNLLKAEKLFKARAFKKSGKLFHKVANEYKKLKIYEKAKNSFLLASDSFLEIDKLSEALNLLRLAGDSYIMMERYTEANQVFKDAVNIISKLRSKKERDSNYITFPVLSYLCLFLALRQNSGLDFIKKYQKRVDPEYFKEHELIQMVTDLTIAIRDKNSQLLENLISNFSNLKLNEAELGLVKLVFMLAKIIISLKSKLSLDKVKYTTNDFIHLTIKLNTEVFNEFTTNSFFEHDINAINITNLNYKTSDNLALSRKIELPLEISNKKSIILESIFKPHFQIDDPYIGPITITFRINDNLFCEYSTDAIKPIILSPPPTLKISIKNLRPPLIGQSFPLEILLENESDGEALDVNVSVEFPEMLKVMRGTTQKQIYSLRSKENMKWELNIKPLEVGDYIIKFHIKFKDSDQNQLVLDQEFPFTIAM